MRMNTFIAAALAISLAGCGSKETTSGADTAVSAGAAASATSANASSTAASAGASSSPSSRSAPPVGGLPGRTGELVDPDHAAMVFLYFDIVGLPPPIDAWAELDRRVIAARPADKQTQRDIARAELQAAAAAVRGVGRLRLSMSGHLSDYDPTYGEFTVGAFAPSSTVQFRAFDQNVSLKFGNGRDAQTWTVSADEAQAVRDRIAYAGTKVDALLVITGTQPSANGGALIADVVEYEVRSAQTNQLLGRVKVGGG